MEYHSAKVAVLLVLSASVAVSCHPPRFPAKLCEEVGLGLTDEQVLSLYRQSMVPVIVADGRAYQCDCGRRQFAGNVEAQRVAGHIESARLDGQSEADRHEGARESTSLAGQMELARQAGAREQTTSAGAVESDQRGGGMESAMSAGGVESERHGGASEELRGGAATEAAWRGGETQPVACAERADCIGFALSARGQVRVFGPYGWQYPTGDCVDN